MTTLSTKTRVIIDTDPGIDDAIALGFALAAKALDIKLITTVSGNVGIKNVTNNANRHRWVGRAYQGDRENYG